MSNDTLVPGTPIVMPPAIDLARWRAIGAALGAYSTEQLAPVLEQALAELASAEAEIARLRRYARHLPGCPVGACDCGWEESER